MLKRPSSSTSTIDSEEACFVTSDEWFQGGRRVPYHPARKRIIHQEHEYALNVFERVRLPLYSPRLPRYDTRWLTLLPGSPTGSYAYAQVDHLLEKRNLISTPRLFVEYVGQGDSDKPKDYPHNTMERADLVQAQWRAHGVHRTVVVACAFSSSVLLELLARQREAHSNYTTIEHVLILSDTLFPSISGEEATALLNTPFGRICSDMALRSNWVSDTLFRILQRNHPNKSTSKAEKRDLQRLSKEASKCIRRRQGTFCLPHVCLSERKEFASRWDLRDITQSLPSVTFRLVLHPNHDGNLEQQPLGSTPQVRTECISKGESLSTIEIVERIESLTHGA